MPYQVFVFVALAIHVLINFNMFIKNDNTPAIRQYRLFAITIAVFYLVDGLWGVFDANKMGLALYIDTFIYFILMGGTIFFWTHFVVKYMDGNNIFSKIISITGALFFLSEIILVIVNIFTPILFTVDESAVYHSCPARDIMLYLQIAMYSIVLIYSLVYTIIRKTESFRRYIAVSLFSLGMIICIAIQLSDPYLPFYSIGLLIGVCILETYVLNESKERFKNANEENKEKLGVALTLAYTDPLTGVKSKHAYVEKEDEYDKLIASGEISSFAVVVFDLNGLKSINDKLGHEAGDKYIVDSVKLISRYFSFDSIYRFGGDEFVSILVDKEFENRKKIHDEFMDAVNKNISSNKPIVSSGISVFKKGVDNTFKAVFYRADKMMYARKEYLKDHSN